MRYTFIKILECNYIETIAEFYAKDEHDAMLQFYKSHDDFDAIMVNGEWI